MADGKGGEEWRLAAEDESLLVTGRGLPEPDPPGSPYQTQAASGPASSSGPLIVPLGLCLMHYNESPGAPRWPGGGGDCGVGPPPTLSLSVTHMAGSTAAPSMPVMSFHNVLVLFFCFILHVFHSYSDFVSSRDFKVREVMIILII